ncbi:MAG: hypothetical protein LC109_11140 [Bacteroidia bacterium]|nr:hypothetical protein [Bacteroidia bacterium]
MKHQQYKKLSFAVSANGEVIEQASVQPTSKQYQETFSSQTEKAKACLQIVKNIKAEQENKAAFMNEVNQILKAMHKPTGWGGN